jgi:hypothetical protein
METIGADLQLVVVPGWSSAEAPVHVRKGVKELDPWTLRRKH